jgi:MoaA/NifB/PqqE/SkfB family radical SAM enzyme
MRKEKMAVTDAFNYIDQIARIPTFKRVALTGGEPLLYLDDILLILSKAKEHGFLTSVISNGFWGVSKEDALKVLNRLISAGLSYCNISCDVFHQEYVPVERVENCLAALKELDFPATLAFTQMPGFEDIRKYLKFEEYERLSIYSGPIVPVNRGSNIPTPHLNNIMLTAEEMGQCAYQKTLTIDPFGKIYPCCAVGGETDYITLGNTRKMNIAEAISEANSRIFLRIIEKQGFGELLKAIKKYDNDFSLEERFITVCHLCNYLSNDAKIVKRMDSALQKYELDLIDGFIEKYIDGINSANTSCSNKVSPH